MLREVLSQRLIHGCGVSKDRRHIRFEQDHVSRGTPRSTCHERVRLAPSQELRLLETASLLAHMTFLRSVARRAVIESAHRGRHAGGVVTVSFSTFRVPS
jgi:hypothetical protein